MQTDKPVENQFSFATTTCEHKENDLPHNFDLFKIQISVCVEDAVEKRLNEKGKCSDHKAHALTSE